MHWKGVIEAYRDYLPVTDKTPVITLLEGNTPLLYAPRLSELTKVRMYLKYEGANPTGSFKDRGMTVAISKALEKGMKAVMCASTGNTSASAAAYAGKAGIPCLVLVPAGYVALGKLSQALIHGAKVLAVEGNFDQALNLVKEITEKYPIELVNSININRIEGQKTAAFEVCDQLESVPDYLAIPVGNAGNITAYWRGFKEYYEAKEITRLPKMIGFQAEGAAPIVKGHPIEKPETVATAIRIGHPASWQGALNAVKESNGSISMVSDQEIIEAYKLLAREEGLFCELASAASVAGVLKLRKKEALPDDSTVVCVLTGHGLKDPDSAVSYSAKPINLPAKLEDVVKALELKS